MTEEGIDILDYTTLEVVDHCDGPLPGWVCPRADRAGVIPCAGHRISPADAAPVYSLMWVPPGSQQCPLAYNLEVAGY
jgi:hypothetical protein